MWLNSDNFLINFINEFSTVADILQQISFVLGIIIAFLTIKIKKRIELYYKKKFLSLNHKCCLIEGEYSTQRWFEASENMALIRNLKVYKWMIQLLFEIGVKPIVPLDSLPDNLEYDEILFEGPAANPKVNFYINTYFPMVKYYVDLNEFFAPHERSKRYNKQFRKRIKAMNCIEDTVGYYGFSVGNTKLEMISGQTDYAILIKLIPDDFPALDKKRTVHILFGWSLAGTRKSIEYFLNHYKKIYKKFKNGHYFIAVKVNKANNEFIAMDDYIDLTEEAFPRRK